MYRFFQKKAVITCIALGLLLGSLRVFSSFIWVGPHLEITPKTPVWDVMVELGKIKTNLPKDPKAVELIGVGENLIRAGYSVKGLSKTKPLSKNMPCIACHTTEPEYSNLYVIEPEKRLEFSIKNRLPFLPGPSFYGMINRIMFFNDDYLTKYQGYKADLIKEAHLDLRKAMDACNQVYALGRPMEEWETEAILMYLWTMELKMGDLDIPTDELDKIKYSLLTDQSNARAVNLMRGYYRETYPATLVPPMEIKERKQISPIINNFMTGKHIYELSCLHCHAKGRYAKFKLDFRKKTFELLRKNFDENSKYSIYDALRYSPGSKAEKTKSPHYTAERLSNKQIQDLRYYITQMAKYGDAASAYFESTNTTEE